jgi:ribonuclease G
MLDGIKIMVRVNPEIAELLHGEENHLIFRLEKLTTKQIVVYPNPQFHLEEFDILSVYKE